MVTRDGSTCWHSSDDGDGAVPALKARLREHVKAIRYVMDEQQWQDASTSIEGRLVQLDEFREAKMTCCYVHKAVTREVQTSAIVEHVLDDPRQQLVVPVTRVDRHELDLSVLHAVSGLSPSTFGVPEPVVEHLVPPTSVDVFIVPCLAVDHRGNRLGYGMGYYDRLFEHLPARVPRVALAFSFQVVDEVPVTARDRPVTAIVTEHGVIRCHQ